MAKRKVLENAIWWLPISPISKLELSRSINQFYNIIRGKKELNESVPLIFNNSYYGHEYWMKKYSNWKHPIYGLIEHGVYFGNNTNMVGDERDYLIKTIITYGDYREEIIKKAFPDHHVIKIGPRIAYVETDAILFQSLIKEYNGSKVLTLFPAHSLVDCKYEYDVDYLLTKAREIMSQYNIEHLRVCLKDQDMKNGTAAVFEEMGCSVVTAGSSEIEFLPRLKAIIESSYLTMANSLGTNLGYCVYLNKPQILIRQDKKVIGSGKDYLKACDSNNPVTKAYKKEEAMFIHMFGSGNEVCITDEQYKLCDYYWGFSHVKEPSELYNIFEDIYPR